MVPPSFSGTFARSVKRDGIGERGTPARRIGFLRIGGSRAVGFRREGQPSLRRKLRHRVARDRHCPLAALKNVPLVDEGMAVAKDDLLRQPRAHHLFLQCKARDRPARRMLARLDKVPAGIRRPAMRGRFLHVVAPKRCAEKIAREAAEVWKDRLVVGDRRIVYPRRRVERRQVSAAEKNLDRAEMPDVEIDFDADPLGENRVETFGHLPSLRNPR